MIGRPSSTFIIIGLQEGIPMADATPPDPSGRDTAIASIVGIDTGMSIISQDGNGRMIVIQVDMNDSFTERCRVDLLPQLERNSLEKCILSVQIRKKALLR